MYNKPHTHVAVSKLLTKIKKAKHCPFSQSVFLLHKSPKSFYSRIDFYSNNMTFVSMFDFQLFVKKSQILYPLLEVFVSKT